MFGLELQLTITLGDVVIAATAVMSAIALWTGIADRLARIETKIEPMWQEYLDRTARHTHGGTT